MTFEHLGDVWRHQDDGDPPRDPAAELETVRARAAEIDRAVRRRDLIETSVAVVMVPLFVWWAVTAVHPVSALGAAIVAGACVFIPIRLRMARRRGPDPSQPLTRALEAELARVRAQSRLLGSVALWYLAPLGVGVILYTAGLPVPPAIKISYATAVVALYGWIFHLNRRAVRHDLGPVERELERWLANSADSPGEGVTDAS